MHGREKAGSGTQQAYRNVGDEHGYGNTWQSWHGESDCPRLALMPSREHLARRGAHVIEIVTALGFRHWLRFQAPRASIACVTNQIKRVSSTFRICNATSTP